MATHLVARRAVAAMAKAVATPLSREMEKGVIASLSLANLNRTSLNLGGVRGIKISKQYLKLRQKQTEESLNARPQEIMQKFGQINSQGETQSSQEEKAPSKKAIAEERRNVLLDLHSQRNPEEVRVAIIDNLASEESAISDLSTREYTHIYQAAIDIGAEASWRSALSLYNAQLKRGVQVEPNTYRALTTLFECAKQWPIALSILETWRREFPTPIFNELGDKVKQTLSAYTPIDYASYKGIEHSSNSSSKGQIDEFEKYVLLRRELKYTVIPDTYELYVNRLLSDGRNADAVAFYFQIMFEMGLAPSADVPKPNSPIDIYPFAKTNKDAFHFNLGTHLRVARAAEKEKNFAAALTVFRVLRSRYNGVGVVPIREVVVPRIGTHSRVALDEDIEGTNAKTAEGVNRQRDFLDLHNLPVNKIMNVVKTYLCELRARRGYVSALSKNGSEVSPSGTNWMVLSDGIPATLSSDPADTLEILTERVYSNSTENTCGSRSRKVCELLNRLTTPIKATSAVSPAGFDATVTISKGELLRWCEAQS